MATSLKTDPEADSEKSTGIDPSNIQGSIEDRFQPNHDKVNLSSRELNAFEGMTGGNYNKTGADDADYREKTSNESVTPTSGKWANKTMPKTITSTNQLGKLLMKRGGPVGAVAGVLLILGGLLGGILAPGSLFLNLKENMTLNWDQQNYTAEIRSRNIITKRLSSDTTNPICATTNKFCLRYQKPSQKMLKDLDRAGVKAIREDGSIIDKQRLLLGERPKYYVHSVTLENDDALKRAIQNGDKTGYKLIDTKNFGSEIKNNAEFRNALRRAYNPRWVNWFDDVSLKFLGKLGLTKAINTAISEAADSKAAKQAAIELIDSKSKSMGDGDVAIKNSIDNMVDSESKKFAQIAGDKVAKSGDSILMTAAVGCTAMQIPGLYTTIIKNYRLAQMAAVAFPVILVTADAIKAGKGTPQMASNMGALLTETSAITKKSAMDSGGMMYGAIGDWRAAAASKTVGKYIPGNIGAGSSAIQAMALAAQTPESKTICNSLNAQELEVALSGIKAAKATNPAGWLMLAADIGLLIAEKTGVLETVITSIINTALTELNKLIDWSSLLAFMAGDFMKDASNEEFGDMTSTAIANVFADLANSGGNQYLKPAQKVAFDQAITNPVKLAWAQEDRLNYSPLDASNPNTFLGSITTQLLPYYGKTKSTASLVVSVASLVGNIPSVFSPNSARAADELEKWQSCPANGDYAVVASGVAAGPLCDIQVGILPEYAEADPEVVVAYLQNRGEVDDEGNVVSGSELESWIQNCNSNSSYNISQCMVDSAIAESSKLAAYRAMYQIDKRIIEGMDNEPKASAEPIPGTPGENIPVGDDSKCDDRTRPLGVYNNAHENGVRKSVMLCAVPNLPAPAYLNHPQYAQFDSQGTAIVNARASGATFEMVEAAKDNGVNLTLGSYFAFRTYEHQTSLRQQWCHKDDCGGAERPGFSNHEMGLAIDFSLIGEAHSSTRRNSKEYLWLARRAAEFGYDDTAMPKEDWHWAYIK